MIRYKGKLKDRLRPILTNKRLRKLQDPKHPSKMLQSHNREPLLVKIPTPTSTMTIKMFVLINHMIKKYKSFIWIVENRTAPHLM